MRSRRWRRVIWPMRARHGVIPRRTLSCSIASREPRRAIPSSPSYSEASHDLVARERGARAYGILQHGCDIPRPFSCGPLQISKVAAASTIPVTSAVAQAKIRKSFRILVIAAPCVHGHPFALAVIRPATRSRWKYLQPPAKRLTVGLVPDREPRPPRRPAASFCDRFGGVPLLAVETDGGEDRKTRHHGHDRSLPPAQSNSGADQKKAEQRPARIDDPLGLEHGARGPKPARWRF
jgi:hypothetical protein